MKKTIINILFIASTVPLLTHCASQSEMEDLQYQLQIVNKKIEDVKSTTVGQLQKRQAAASSQMDALEKDILSLKSQLEESYYLNQKLREQNKELETAITNVAQQEAMKREEALLRLEQQQQQKEVQLAELNQNLKAIQDARIKEAERRARETALAAELAKTRSRVASSRLAGEKVTSIKATQKKVTMSVVAPPRTAPSTATVTPQKSDSVNVPQPQGKTADGTSQNASLLKQGQNFYDQGNFRDAYAVFEKIADNSSSPDRADGRFMMGESLFQLKEYDKAIMQYQKIISQHPSHSKAAAAMLQQATAFEKLADKDTAKVIYKKLVKTHPNSSQAALAAKKLEKM